MNHLRLSAHPKESSRKSPCTLPPGRAVTQPFPPPRSSPGVHQDRTPNLTGTLAIGEPPNERLMKGDTAATQD